MALRFAAFIPHLQPSSFGLSGGLSGKSRPPPSPSREAASAWIAAAIAAAALRAARLKLILQRLPLLLRQQRPLAGEHLQLPIKDRVAHLPHAIPRRNE